jgi:hypothetical protein
MSIVWIRIFAEILAKLFHPPSDIKLPFRTGGRYGCPVEVWNRMVIQDYATKLFRR